MDNTSIVLIFIIFTISVWYVVQPLFLDKIKNIVDGVESFEALLLKKNVLLEQIKELEMDFEIGNIDEDDFEKVRNDLKSKAAIVLESIKKAKK